MPEPEALVSFLAPSDWREQLDGADAVRVFESWVVPSLFDDPETVERVARAIWATGFDNPSQASDFNWEFVSSQRTVFTYYNQARAAIAALRGDTDA